MTKPSWYLIENTAALDSPALVVYPERVRQNIGRFMSSVESVERLRPHVKAHKSADVARLMLAAGICQFKCATIAEAEMLADCGAPDVLLAYQPNGAKMHRLLALVTNYPATSFSCLVDNDVTAGLLSALAVEAGIELSVYVDLNVGMNRTGISPGPGTVALYNTLGQLTGLKPVGLHAYDGHIRDADFAVRSEKCRAAFKSVFQLAQQLEDAGFNKPIIVAGGSGTFPIHAQHPNVVCSPGTFVYWDKGYADTFIEQPFEPAALLISRVISRPSPTMLCLDLGHKSVASEMPLAQRVTFLNAPELQLIGQSEEHLVVDAGEGHAYQVGDIFYGLPTHICPTVALHERAYTVEKGIVTSEWLTTARDRRLTY